jgi:hypothetical protein
MSATAPSSVKPLQRGCSEVASSDVGLWAGISEAQPRPAGAERGVGATYAWEGNSKAGAGSMTIAAATPQKTSIALHFTKPMRSENTAEFTLDPDGAGKRVTWIMTGPRTQQLKQFRFRYPLPAPRIKRPWPQQRFVGP